MMAVSQKNLANSSLSNILRHQNLKHQPFTIQREANNKMQRKAFRRKLYHILDNTSHGSWAESPVKW